MRDKIKSKVGNVFGSHPVKSNKNKLDLSEINLNNSQDKQEKEFEIQKDYKDQQFKDFVMNNDMT